jgi:hypothetical protein
MNNIIQFDFKKAKEAPSNFYINWIPAYYERCPNPVAWTYHVKFRVYQTDKNYAFQMSTGIGGKGYKYPNAFSNGRPYYQKDLNKLWGYIFEILKNYNVDISYIEKEVKKHKLKSACV